VAVDIIRSAMATAGVSRPCVFLKLRMGFVVGVSEAAIDANHDASFLPTAGRYRDASKHLTHV
jgi:hypothetical protein